MSDVAISTSEEPHPNPPLAKGRGPEGSLVNPEEPHPNPPLAKGRGPDALANPEEPHPNPPLAKGRGPDALAFCSLVFLNADFLRNSVKSLGGNIPQVAQTW